MSRKQLLISAVSLIAAVVVIVLGIHLSRAKVNNLNQLLTGFYESKSYGVQMFYVDEEDEEVSIIAYYTKDQGLMYVEEEVPYRFSFLKQDVYKGLDDKWAISLPESPRAIPGSPEWLLNHEQSYFTNGKVSLSFDKEGCLQLELANNCVVVRLADENDRYWLLYFDQNKQQIVGAIDAHGDEATTIYMFGFVNETKVAVATIFAEYETAVREDIKE